MPHNDEVLGGLDGPGGGPLSGYEYDGKNGSILTDCSVLQAQELGNERAGNGAVSLQNHIKQWRVQTLEVLDLPIALRLKSYNSNGRRDKISSCGQCMQVL